MNAYVTRACALGLLLALLLGSGLLAGCARPGEEKCKRVCLHYSKLFLDQKWAQKAEGLSPEELATLEKDKAAEWEDVQTNPNRGIYACVGACNRMTRGSTADCILAATSFDQAKACDPR